MHPERYDGVRTRRIFAFLVDAAVVFFLMVVAYVVHRASSASSRSASLWLLVPAVWPVVAILYSVLTLGGPSSATPGMRFTGIEMRTVRRRADWTTGSRFSTPSSSGSPSRS